MHPTRVAILLALIAAPAFASRVTIYPLAADGVEAGQVRDIEGMVKSALLRLRSPTLALDSLDSLEPSCGSASKAKSGCLAKLARGGVIVTGVVSRAGRLLRLSLVATDARGRISGPVQAGIDPAVENLKPIVAALQDLDAAIASGASPPAAAAPAPSAAPAPFRPRAPAAAVEAAPQPGGDKWLTRAAVGSGIGALAALAGAGTFGYLAKRTNDDLTSRFNAHTLTTADAGSYQAVKRDDKIATVCLVVSGVLAVAGVTFWALLADDDGASGRHF
ncbi:MAG: hypothetical protein ACXWLM_08335 [Myxococcales bacterium]